MEPIKLESTEFPDDLPIEAIHGVTSILASLIAMVTDVSFFVGADNFEEYKQSVKNLERDLADCYALHDAWKDDADADKFEAAFVRMELYLEEAAIVLKKAKQVIH